MSNPLTTVRKQHFWEWFSGDTLNSRWTTTNIVGTNSYAMNDSTNGGFKITSGANNGDVGGINFNNKRQFAHDGSVHISIWKKVATSSRIMSGLKNSGTDQVQTEFAICYDGENGTWKILTTGDASSNSSTVSSVAEDTSFHNYKIETSSSNIVLDIDGVTEVTKTTNRPTVKLQPVFQTRTLTSATKEGLIRYCEAYNT
jgi:hypothetical protein